MNNNEQSISDKANTECQESGYNQHASLFELQTVVLLDAQSRIHMLR
jgi:hypothetical protein